MSEHIYKIISGGNTGTQYDLNTYGKNLFDVRISQVTAYSKQVFDTLQDLFKNMVMYDDKMEEYCNESYEKVPELSEFYDLPHKVLVELLFLCNNLSADIAMKIVSKIIAYQLKQTETVQSIFDEF